MRDSRASSAVRSEAPKRGDPSKPAPPVDGVHGLPAAETAARCTAGTDKPEPLIIGRRRWFFRGRRAARMKSLPGPAGGSPHSGIIPAPHRRRVAPLPRGRVMPAHQTGAWRTSGSEGRRWAMTTRLSVGEARRRRAAAAGPAPDHLATSLFLFPATSTAYVRGAHSICAARAEPTLDRRGAEWDADRSDSCRNAASRPTGSPLSPSWKKRGVLVRDSPARPAIHRVGGKGALKAASRSAKNRTRQTQPHSVFRPRVPPQ